jgi:hypothetical protein
MSGSGTPVIGSIEIVMPTFWKMCVKMSARIRPRARAKLITRTERDKETREQ